MSGGVHEGNSGMYPAGVYFSLMFTDSYMVGGLPRGSPIAPPMAYKMSSTTPNCVKYLEFGTGVAEDQLSVSGS